MSDITLAPTDNWQAAFREFDGYGNITLHGGQEYNAVGGITFKAPRANVRSNGPLPPKINGYWSVENTSLTLRNIDYTPPPGSMLFYIRGGRLALMDPKVTIPPEYPQIKSLASINEAGFDIDATTRAAEFNVGDRITSEVFDIDGCKFKFSGSSKSIQLNMSGPAISIVFDSSDGKASGLQINNSGKVGSGIEARRGSRITLGTGTRLSGLDIGVRALHSSDIFFESGSVFDCNQGLREQGGRIRASQSKVIFAGNNTDRIIVPVDAI